MPKRRRTVVKSKHAQIARKRKKIMLSLATILVVGGVAGLTTWLLTDDQFALKKVSVTGLDTLSEDSFTRVAEDYLDNPALVVLSQRNKFIFDEDGLEEQITSVSPKVSSVEISESNEEVRIHLEERKPYAQWCGEEQCLILDKTGFAFEEIPEIIGYRYITFETETRPEIGKKYPSLISFESILVLLDGIRSLDITPLAYREEGNTGFVKVETDNRTGISGELKLDPNNWETSLSNLSLLINNGTLQKIRASEGEGRQFAYIDLRFGNKVFYSFYPESHLTKDQSESTEESTENDVEIKNIEDQPTETEEIE
jgi:cell division septal protein FtsQ